MRPSRQTGDDKKEWQTALSALLEKRAKKPVAPPPPPSPIVLDDVSDDSSSDDYEDARSSHSTDAHDRSYGKEADIDSLTNGMKFMGLSGARTRGEESAKKQSDEQSDEESDEDDDCRIVTPSSSTAATTDLVAGPANEYKLRGAISGKLYPHQVEGVKWLYKLYKEEKGGILGDDMGLGKTMQCAAFIAGLIQCNLAKSIIIIAPKTLLAHWEKELQVCQVGRYVVDFCGGSEGARAQTLRNVAQRTSIMLTTYGMVQHNYHRLKSPGDSRYADEPFKWDLMILDEGHKIKNPKMQLYQRMQEIPVKVCVIISGTPIQNNLSELWALYNFCTPDLLGTKSWFKTQFENIITDGQNKEATSYQRQRGAAKAAELRQLIEPYLLRREKKTVLVGRVDDAEKKESTDGSSQPKPQGMPHKNDFIVWLQPSPLQQSVYRAYLHSSAVQSALCESAHPLAAITVLKKICDHPALLSKRAAGMVMRGAKKWAGVGLQDDESEEEESEAESDDSLGDFIVDDDESDEEWERKRAEKKKQKEAMKNRRKQVSALDDEFEQLDSGVESKILEHLEKSHEKGADASCKTSFVLTLLDQLVVENHRLLVFSQSRVMLDIIQAAIIEKGLKFCRIDGSMAKASDRQREVNRFQEDASIPVFLLTSQVGGLGLTITAADRVVIVDPAWNPATDNQSVDRAYRIGQTRDVVVYRLITCGTVEEKIYRRQVFKAGLFRTGVEEGVQFRYFSTQEIRDLFDWRPEEVERSVTQAQLHELHAHERKASPEVLKHLQFLESLEGFAGVSDHDLLFSKKSEDERYDDLPPEALATAPKPYAEPLSQQPPGADLGLDAITSRMKGMNIRPSATAAPTAPADLELARIRKDLDVAKDEAQKYESYLKHPTFKMSEEGKDKLMRKLESCQERVAMLLVKERKHLKAKAEGEKLKNITNVSDALPVSAGFDSSTNLKGSSTSSATGSFGAESMKQNNSSPIEIVYAGPSSKPSGLGPAKQKPSSALHTAGFPQI